MKGPLQGAGILITRPARHAGGFAQKIAAIGGTPVVFPAIVILPPAEPAALQRVQRGVAQYDYAVFVSANAVEYGVPDPRQWPRHLVAFAPGAGTAEALAAAGIAEIRVPLDRQDSDGLLALPELTHPAGKRVIIFRGDDGREQLGETLRARGALVDCVSCYRRAKPQSGVAGLVEAFAAGNIDAVTVTSTEGLGNLWSLLDAMTRERWSRLPTFAPHARIVEHARGLGFHCVPTGPGDAGLVAGLLEWFAAHPFSPHPISRN